VTALVISLVLAVALGTWAGLRPASWPARVVGTITTITYSVPPFIVALVALFMLAVHWQLFPAGGVAEIGDEPTPAGVALHLILPAIVLALGALFGAFTRIVAASVAEAAQSEYALAAGARGVSHPRVVTGHVLRTSLLPLVAQVGASMNAIVGGTFAVEVVFSWPGLGPAGVVAAKSQDYSVMMAIVLITGVVVVIGNLLADLTSSALDPRIRAIPGRRRRAIRGPATPAATP
jgi:peptide/nickel transport system permease protein